MEAKRIDDHEDEHTSTDSSNGVLFDNFRQQMRRIDELETRIEARAMQSRRRIMNLLQSHYAAPQPVRHSHLRMWLTHLHEPAKVLSTEDRTKTIPETFTLQIEGKLLVDHLDHASAAAHDRKTGYKPSADDELGAKVDREDDRPIPALNLTQLFERVSVEFETVYQPKIHPMARIHPAAGAKKKSSRRSSAGASSSGQEGSFSIHPDDVDFKKCHLSQRQTIVWTNTMSTDAQAWAFEYQPPLPSTGAYEVHSVICRLNLYTRSFSEERFIIQNEHMINHLFPSHGKPEPTRDEILEEQLRQQNSGDNVYGSGKKRKSDEVETTSDGKPFPPQDSDIQVSTTSLTMPQIIQALTLYVEDKNLLDPEEKSVIVCDEVLKGILGTERLPFAQLQATLIQTSAVQQESPTNVRPTRATYVMRKDTAWNVAPRGVSDDDKEGQTSAALWQWDMECTVPQFFPNRARELLRRIKRRELEYLSSRSRARQLLLGQRVKDENLIRQQMEAVVVRKSLAPSLQPMIRAMALGAPNGSEVQRVLQTDSQISYLLEQLPMHCRTEEAAMALAQCHLLCTQWN